MTSSLISSSFLICVSSSSAALLKTTPERSMDSGSRMKAVVCRSRADWGQERRRCCLPSLLDCTLSLVVSFNKFESGMRSFERC